MNRFELLIEDVLLEITAKDLKKDYNGTSDPHSGLTTRAKKVDVRLEKITDDGVMHWSAKAVTTNGVDRWKQEVVLKDWKDAMGMEDLKFAERANLAAFGDLELKCSDPSWLYWGYKYIATQLGYNEGKGENRAPDERNPKEEGVVCKHLIAVLNALPFHINDIAAAMEKTKKESIDHSRTERLIDTLINSGDE